MAPHNRDQVVPMVWTGPEESREYFDHIDRFLVATLGEAARAHYQIVIGDPAMAAHTIGRSVRKVQTARRRNGDAFYFNWLLHIPDVYQRPFEVTHAAVRELELRGDLPPAELASNLRRAFSAIVSGNVKAQGIQLVRRHGPFELRADPAIMTPLDRLLTSFVAQRRMKLVAESYEPCYRLIGAP
jgi:hypothetical protein